MPRTLSYAVLASLWLAVLFLCTEAREKRFQRGDASGNDSYCFFHPSGQKI